MSLWNQALKVVKGDSLNDMVEQFTQEMTLVAEGLCEDQARLRRAVDGLIKEGEGQRAKSEQDYQDVLRQSPHNSEAQYALLDHYAQQEDDENFFRQLQVCVKNKHVEEKVRAEVLKMYTSHCVQKQEASLPKLRAFLDTLEHPENATGEILVVHTALLWQMNAAPDSLMNLINRTLRFQPENTSIRLHGVSLCFNNDQDDEVIRLCDEGQFYDPQEIRFYYFSAAYKLKQGKVDETLEMLERGESYFMESEDKELASEIYGMMGDLYHERADLERAFAAYDNALTCNPDNASALNNYAYFLSLDERDLQKAMTMVVFMGTANDILNLNSKMIPLRIRLKKIIHGMLCL